MFWMFWMFWIFSYFYPFNLFYPFIQIPFLCNLSPTAPPGWISANCSAW